MFTAIPTEQTTAVTDLLLSIQAFITMLVVRRHRAVHPVGYGVWMVVLGLLSLASLLGAIAHGFDWSQAALVSWWRPLYLMLGLIAALFVVAAVALTIGERPAYRSLPWAVVVALIFFSVTQLWSDSFLLFIMYEGLMLLFALTLYARSYALTGTQGTGFLAVGVLIALLAGGVDSQTGLRLNLFWSFDNHGLFHLVQMLSVMFFRLGLVAYAQVGPAQVVRADSGN
ncbi:MAG: hypothetical protein U0795_06845 [Pirellulales bacterium]